MFLSKQYIYTAIPELATSHSCLFQIVILLLSPLNLLNLLIAYKMHQCIGLHSGFTYCRPPMLTFLYMYNPMAQSRGSCDFAALGILGGLITPLAIVPGSYSLSLASFRK